MSTTPMQSGPLVPDFNTPISIPTERIAGTVVSAIEGGITYWCRAMERVEGDPGFAIAELSAALDFGTKYPTYAVAGHGYGLRLLEDKEGDGPDVWHELNRANLEAALSLMATKYPHHFADILNENDDATTGDVLVQLALFGELVYG